MNYTMQIHFKTDGSFTGHAFLELRNQLTGKVYYFGFTTNDATHTFQNHYDGHVETTENQVYIDNPEGYGLISSRRIVLSENEFNQKLLECQRIEGEANFKNSFDYKPMFQDEYDISDGMHCLEFVHHILNTGSSNVNFKLVGDYFSRDQIQDIASESRVGSYSLVPYHTRYDKLPSWTTNSFVTHVPYDEFIIDSSEIERRNLAYEFRIADGEMSNASGIGAISTNLTGTAQAKNGDTSKNGDTLLIKFH